METPTTLAPSEISLDHFDDNMNNNSTDFLKMEDFDASSPAQDSQGSTPDPIILRSQPAKKRKSWGQQLPEPKTTLPPRKRAKTEDEKEQRRIERIKRNRAAAHNSRERKRQEAEVLSVLLAEAEQKLKAYERLHGPLPSHIVLPKVISIPEESATTPAPSHVESRGSVDVSAGSASPPGLFDNCTMEIKQEPHDTPKDIAHDAPFSESHQSFDNLNAKPQMPTLQLLDQTQHSAAMLLTSDLPCQSSSRMESMASTQMHSSTPIFSIWTLIMLQLFHTQIMTSYKALLLGLWRISPSRVTARMTQALTRASTSRLTTGSNRKTTWMPRSPSATALAQRNAATVVARLALQRSLVGTDRQGRSLAVASQQGRAAGEHTRALEERHEERGFGDDDNDGVGRSDGASG